MIQSIPGPHWLLENWPSDLVESRWRAAIGSGCFSEFDESGAKLGKNLGKLPVSSEFHPDLGAFFESPIPPRTSMSWA